MRLALLVALVALLSIGCRSDALVIDQAPEERVEQSTKNYLSQYIATYSGSKRTPQDFVALHSSITSLTNADDNVRAVADRNLIFAAIQQVSESNNLAASELADSYATSVWPYALEQPIKKDETPTAYMQRICETVSSLQCLTIVSPMRAVLLHATAIKEIDFASLKALRKCDNCGDVLYQRQREQIVTLRAFWDKAAQDAKHNGSTKVWPYAKGNRQAATTKPVLQRSPGGLFILNDKLVGKKRLQKALKQERKKSPVLSVLFEGKDPIIYLQQATTVARKVGYKKVELFARTAQSPYEQVVYTILLTRSGKANNIPVSSFDTIQTLIEQIDETPDPLRLRWSK